MNNDSREGVIFGLSMTAMVAIFVAVCVGIGLLIFGLNGWGQVQNAKRQGTINNIQSKNYVHNSGYQQAERDAVTADLTEVRSIAPQMVGQSEQERQALGAQRLQALGQLCSDAAKVDASQGPLPQQAFVAANCSSGAPNPGSPYETKQDQPNP